MPGRLILCSTPIGNLGDVTLRLRESLADADVIFAEDTRRTATLLRHLGIDRPMRSYFAGNEAARASELRRRLEREETIALVTDAGTPAVSDPGLSAVRVAVESAAIVTVVPGPSAVLAALTVSGLPSERFVFEGFLPRKPGPRHDRLVAIGAEERTIVLFAASSRVARDLTDLATVAGGDRHVVVARELTKAHEELWRGTLSDAADHWSHDVVPRGEFTLVLAGAAPESPKLGDIVGEVLELEAGGSSISHAVRAAAAQHGVSRRELYEAVIRFRGDA